MKNWIFWLLFLLVLPQALWVRKTAPRFKDANGERSGSIGYGPCSNLLAIGDSIIAGVGAETMPKALVGQTARSLADGRQATVQWQALGKTGIGSAGVIARQLPELPTTTPDFILVSVGVNDVTKLTRLSNWVANLDQLFKRLHQFAPNARIAFAGLPPLGRFPLLPQPLRMVLGLRARLLDEAAVEVIAKHDYVVHVPLAFDLKPEQFSADGYHPNEESYVEYGRLMAEALLANKRI